MGQRILGIKNLIIFAFSLKAGRLKLLGSRIMKPRITQLAFISVFFIAFPAAGFSQTTWYVDDDNISGPWDGSQQNPFQHIQDGIDAALNGDTVLVMPGTYVENIDFLGKAITVKSSGGSSSTTIDGRNGWTVVKFVAYEGPTSVIDGFTIKNGNGGVSGYFGGGIACYSAAPTIMNNQFIDNAALSGGGGIALLFDSMPLIMNNTFTGNSGGVSGGAIYFNQRSNATAINNTFSENSAEKGAGINCSNDSNPKIVNNLFYANTASNAGAAIFCLSNSNAEIINCTLCGNSASNSGGGLYCNGSSPTFTNTIFWNNSAPSDPEIKVHSGNPTFTYCDIKGGWTGTGNIDADPLFISGPFGGYYLSQIAAGQGSDSPCLNAGSDLSPNLWVDGVTRMQDLATRKDHGPDVGTVDIGYHHLFEVCTRFGNVDLGNGTRAKTYKVNGSGGDSKRVYSISAGSPVTLTMDAPPAGPNPANFALYVFQFEPGLLNRAKQPYGVGSSCMPMPLSNGTINPPPVCLVNNIGYKAALGIPFLPWVGPAPCTILNLPYGLQAGTYTFQGYIFDDGSFCYFNFSLTNAIVLKVQ